MFIDDTNSSKMGCGHQYRVGIICPPGLDRVRVAAKTWCGHVTTSTCPKAHLGPKMDTKGDPKEDPKGDPKGVSKKGSKKGSKRGYKRLSNRASKKVYGAKKENPVL